MQSEASLTWQEPGGDLVHAVEGSSQQEEDASDEVEVVDKPQLHCRDINSVSVMRHGAWSRLGQHERLTLPYQTATFMEYICICLATISPIH